MHIFDELTRSERLGRYIIEHRATVREAAAYFGISKSTVHKDVTTELRDINYSLFLQTNKVLQQNKNERHLRGGEATKKKYEEKKRKDGLCRSR